MYKRDRFVFVSNLHDITCDPENPLTLKRDAYLLSEPYVTDTTARKMLFARTRRNLVVGDNGNFSRMSAIARRHQSAARKILDSVDEDATGTPKVSARQRSDRRKLVDRIVQDCAEELDRQDKKKIIETQLRIRPHLMIGLEDFTIPVLDLCGLMHPAFADEVDQIKDFQKRTKSLFLAQAAGSIGVTIPDETELSCVIHALDYATAFAGTYPLRRKNEITSIAISYGAPMTSRKWVESIKVGRKRVKFEAKLPEAYVKAQSLTLGALRGIDRKVRLHILGAGSPIVLVLTALFVPDTEGLSIDSTAPLKDAYMGRIYGKRNAFMKMRMYRLAAHHLVEGTAYTSTSPFWKAFDGKHPSDWEGLRRKLEITSDTKASKLARTLEKRQDLVQRYIPYFSKGGVGSKAFQEEVKVARTGSNYWVLRAVCHRIRRRLDDPEKIRSWVEKEIKRYEKYADPRWAKAARAAYDFSI